MYEADALWCTALVGCRAPRCAAACKSACEAFSQLPRACGATPSSTQSCIGADTHRLQQPQRARVWVCRLADVVKERVQGCCTSATGALEQQLGEWAVADDGRARLALCGLEAGLLQALDAGEHACCLVTGVLDVDWRTLSYLGGADPHVAGVAVHLNSEIARE